MAKPTDAKQAVAHLIETKRQAEQLQRFLDRAGGELDRLRRDLSKELGGEPTFADGRQALTKLNKDAARIEERFAAAVAEYRSTWGEQLKGT